MFLGPERLRKVERVNRRAVFGEPQVTEAAMMAKQGNKLGTPLTEGFRWLAISENNGLGSGRHVQNPPVIFRAHRINHFQQPHLVGGAVGVDVTDQLTAISPGSGELPRLAERGICKIQAGHAGIHQQPENQRLGRLPNFLELITVLLALRKNGGDCGIRRPGRTDLSARVVSDACISKIWHGFRGAVARRAGRVSLHG
jgi:hypothetical protein